MRVYDWDLRSVRWEILLTTASSTRWIGRSWSIASWNLLSNQLWWVCLLISINKITCLNVTNPPLSITATSPGHAVLWPDVHQGTRATDPDHEGDPALDGPGTVPWILIHKSQCNIDLSGGVDLIWIIAHGLYCEVSQHQEHPHPYQRNCWPQSVVIRILNGSFARTLLSHGVAPKLYLAHRFENFTSGRRTQYLI